MFDLFNRRPDIVFSRRNTCLDGRILQGDEPQQYSVGDQWNGRGASSSLFWTNFAPPYEQQRTHQRRREHAKKYMEPWNTTFPEPPRFVNVRLRVPFQELLNLCSLPRRPRTEADELAYLPTLRSHVEEQVQECVETCFWHQTVTGTVGSIRVAEQSVVVCIEQMTERRVKCRVEIGEVASSYWYYDGGYGGGPYPGGSTPLRGRFEGTRFTFQLSFRRVTTEWTAMEGEELKAWRDDDGWIRYHLAGKAVPAGAFLEVRLHDGSWARVRFERTNRTQGNPVIVEGDSVTELTSDIVMRFRWPMLP